MAKTTAPKLSAADHAARVAELNAAVVRHKALGSDTHVIQQAVEDLKEAEAQPHAEAVAEVAQAPIEASKE